MTITSTCPGCGATLTINENETSVTCVYCGTHFDVNLQDTNPSFRKAEPPPEAAPAVSPESSPLYNPPIPGQPATPPSELYNPPIPDAASAFPTGDTQPYSPPPFTPSPPQPQGFFSGNRPWIAIAIVAAVLLCLSCLCIFVVAQRIVR